MKIKLISWLRNCHVTRKNTGIDINDSIILKAEKINLSDQVFLH